MSFKTLKALRTKAEAECEPELGEVFIVASPVKNVASLLRHADTSIDASDRVVLSHLRRVAKIEQLPERIHQFILDRGSPSISGSRANSSNACTTPDEPVKDHQVVYVLLCRASVSEEQIVNELLRDPHLAEASTNERQIVTVKVPIVPPATQEQASSWSEEHWPTIYKKHNPYGPQHNIITGATAEIAETAPVYMELANAVGAASCVGGLGVLVGAAVIDRSTSKGGQIIAVAGDARWYRQPDSKISGHGNPMAHAAMRAIAMVARKRKALEDGAKVDCKDSDQSNSFLDYPITPIERESFSLGKIDGTGYLCLNLEIYLTHEPCVMCSMALLHARFGKVIFGQIMPSTGGLVTGDGRIAGYGLFWLPSLNWKLLAWQWAEADVANKPADDTAWHA